MVVKVHSGTVLGDEFAAMLKKGPRMHFDSHLDPVSRTTSKVARQSESKFLPQYSFTVQRFDLTSNGPYVPSIAESNILGVRVIESLPLLQFAKSGSE